MIESNVERLLREPKDAGTLNGKRLLLRSNGRFATYSLDRVRGIAVVFVDVDGPVEGLPEAELSFTTSRGTATFFGKAVQVVRRMDLGPGVSSILVELPIAQRYGEGAPTIEDELGLPR